jgi:hypothetical protein
MYVYAVLQDGGAPNVRACVCVCVCVCLQKHTHTHTHLLEIMWCVLSRMRMQCCKMEGFEDFVATNDPTVLGAECSLGAYYVCVCVCVCGDELSDYTGSQARIRCLLYVCLCVYIYIYIYIYIYNVYSFETAHVNVCMPVCAHLLADVTVCAYIIASLHYSIYQFHTNVHWHAHTHTHTCPQRHN